MKKQIFKHFILVLLLACGINAFASDVVVLKNGNVIKGEIVSRTETSIVIKVQNGTTYEYPMIQVQKITDSEEFDRSMPKDAAKSTASYTDYGDMDSGFWFSTEIGEALSCNIKGGNYTFTELDAIGGYRFNEFLRLGIGIGARYYNNNGHRFSSISWGMPIYGTVRGNIIPGEYRNVVPYYSVDMGASIRDGFMFRPGIGMRIGQKRNAFIASLSYLGQNIISTENNARKNKFTSFVMLRIGYEF